MGKWTLAVGNALLGGVRLIGVFDDAMEATEFGEQQRYIECVPVPLINKQVAIEQEIGQRWPVNDMAPNIPIAPHQGSVPPQKELND
jgi:hypothetical protein